MCAKQRSKATPSQKIGATIDSRKAFEHKVIKQDYTEKVIKTKAKLIETAPKGMWGEVLEVVLLPMTETQAKLNPVSPPDQENNGHAVSVIMQESVAKTKSAYPERDAEGKAITLTIDPEQNPVLPHRIADTTERGHRYQEMQSKAVEQAVAKGGDAAAVGQLKVLSHAERKTIRDNLIKKDQLEALAQEREREARRGSKIGKKASSWHNPGSDAYEDAVEECWQNTINKAALEEFEDAAKKKQREEREQEQADKLAILEAKKRHQQEEAEKHKKEKERLEAAKKAKEKEEEGGPGEPEPAPEMGDESEVGEDGREHAGRPSPRDRAPARQRTTNALDHGWL